MQPREMDDRLKLIKAKCLGSLLHFIQVFYELRTGRTFNLSHPKSNESHFITVCRELTGCFRGSTNRLMINLPPGWGKSEICKHFIAWCMAHYPDSNFLYVSHSLELAAKHTHSIKQIIEFPLFKELFGVSIRTDSAAKDYFTTTAGGVVSGWGAKGGITGYDAGLPDETRFTGCLIIDDIHKPDEVHSTNVREHVKRNYVETLERRLRSPRVPVIFIGQRLHEDDLPGNLLGNEKSGSVGFDGRVWDRSIIKAIDDAGNAVYPEVSPLDTMDKLEKSSPYTFASQYQQNPQPAGGALFKGRDFVLLSEEPDIIGTFITCDTAETSKTWNDATVFSYFGVYKIKERDMMTDLYGLHWLDCREVRIEPKDLEPTFLQFYSECCRFHVKPQFVAIEKKSTGVTLSSVLSDMRGIKVIQVERTIQSGNKTARFLSMQPFVASKRISFPDPAFFPPEKAAHVEMCLTHMQKITANDTHKHDDIADTLYDGIRLGLMDNIIMARIGNKPAEAHQAKRIMGKLNRTLRIRKRRSW